MKKPNNVVKLVVFAGVSGSGKNYLAGRFVKFASSNNRIVKFVDADDFHPPYYRDRAREGIPMDDDYRRHWIAMIVKEMSQKVSDGNLVVLACSALKRWTRDELRKIGGGAIHFVWFDVPKNILLERLHERDEENWHFYGADLLPSQLEDMEKPKSNEPQVTILKGVRAKNRTNLARIRKITGWF